MRYALAAALVLAGAAPVAASAAPPGRALYQTHCSSCHGLALQGSPDGPPLAGKSAADVDFMLRTGRMPAAIVRGEQLAHPAAFDDAQIRAIVAYVASAGQGDREIPRLEAGDVVRGRQVFAENCQACHGVTAHGASVGYAQVAPSLMEASPEEIAEAVRVGPGEMPAFGKRDVPSARLDDVVAYVGLLQQRSYADNPGGLQLANVGPVAEGFVGWVFGLGLLVLVCRWIGTTR
ncbi:MAG TPA: c-type cytochrome [Candidatus Tumulicola sp.]|jgi:ubiquinol-cytochrome c reductase cytochrome c subunit